MSVAKTFAFTSFLLLGLVDLGDSHSTGSGIDAACSDLIPKHFGTQKQTSLPPFSISFTPSSYRPGLPISVTIRSCTEAGFRGFLIQAAYSANNKDKSIGLGSFTPVAQTMQNCQGNTVLTHSDSSIKQSLTFNWNPPSTPQGPIVFRATFVRSFTEYWVDVDSKTLSDPSAPPESVTLQGPSDLDPVCQSVLGRPG